MGVTFIAPQGTYTAPAKLVSKSITENGTYDATDDSANGYSSVTVNVEGGGGSSDFSTAEVTVVNEIDGETLWTYLPILQGDTIRTDYSIDTVGTTTYTIALYKGSAIINYGHAGETLVVVEVSGNATDNMAGQITITGDCTLTYSAGLQP